MGLLRWFGAKRSRLAVAWILLAAVLVSAEVIGGTVETVARPLVQVCVMQVGVLWAIGSQRAGAADAATPGDRRPEAPLGARREYWSRGSWTAGHTLGGHPLALPDATRVFPGPRRGHPWPDLDGRSAVVHREDRVVGTVYLNAEWRGRRPVVVVTFVTPAGRFRGGRDLAFVRSARGAERLRAGTWVRYGRRFSLRWRAVEPGERVPRLDRPRDSVTGPGFFLKRLCLVAVFLLGYDAVLTAVHAIQGRGPWWPVLVLTAAAVPVGWAWSRVMDRYGGHFLR